MSTDLHWLIERRDASGRWHATASKSYFWAWTRTQNVPWNERLETLESAIAERDAERFAHLSGIGDLGAPRLTRPGLPGDAAKGTFQEQLVYGIHGYGWGHASGTDVLGWLDSAIPTVRTFAQRIIDLLGTGRADTILADIVRDTGHDADFTDLRGIESAHARAERLRASAALADWRTDPGSWRLFVYFDN